MAQASPAALPVRLVVLAIVAWLLPLRRALLSPILASRRLTCPVRSAFGGIPLVGPTALARDLGDPF